MFRKILAVTAAVSLMAGASFAAPAKPAKKAAKPAKVVEVKTCPVTGGKVTGKGSGSRTIGNYKVYFCCAGCDKEWDSWSAQKKLQTAKKLAAQEAAAKKKKA